MDTQERKRIPLPALLLGIGGLVPFAAAPIAMGSDRVDNDWIIRAFTVYSAVILSFLGGIRWGQAVSLVKSRTRELALSVIPSLWAWFSLLIPSPLITTLLLIMGFATTGLADRYYPSPATTAWMINLRTLLTIVVVGCHGAMAGFVIFGS